jgi:glycine cleavage system transcriptional repressor
VPILAVAVVGPDRPGLVAAITEVVLAHAGSLHDVTVTARHGQALINLVADVPLTAARLQEQVERVASGAGQLVSVRPLDPASLVAPSRVPYLVAVHGADRPGIVHGLAALLAEYEITIRDLSARLAGALAVLVVEMEIPEDVDLDGFEALLGRWAVGQGVEAYLRAVQADVL